jgi:hypothetical protein
MHLVDTHLLDLLEDIRRLLEGTRLAIRRHLRFRTTTLLVVMAVVTRLHQGVLVSLDPVLLAHHLGLHRAFHYHLVLRLGKEDILLQMVITVAEGGKIIL